MEGFVVHDYFDRILSERKMWKEVIDAAFNSGAWAEVLICLQEMRICVRKGKNSCDVGWIQNDTAEWFRKRGFVVGEVTEGSAPSNKTHSVVFLK